MINKIDIDESIKYYNINEKYKEKCYKCITEINNNKKHLEIFDEVYKKLNNEDFETIKKLWKEKEIEEIFCKDINPFATNLMILLFHKKHIENIKKHKLSRKQINIHKKRIKECFESDLINRNYESVRISQMLWAMYFINIKIIEIGRLQYQYYEDENKKPVIKIHIPAGSKLEIKKVLQSLKKSKKILPKAYNIKNIEYVCNSWLLSKELNEIIDKNSNIHKFYNLFEVEEGKECTSDILNFVYSLKECKDYNELEENTSLQRLLKKELIKNKKFNLGLGNLRNYESIRFRSI